MRDRAALLALSAALTLPGLGAASLWDVDEGVNAQAAREMREADSWVVPTFNYELRTAKPVLLYWLQRASYAALGVSEWSARLPSAAAGCLAVLLVYGLARRMFGRATGLLAGVALASAPQFAVLARAATPDATLLFFTALTYLAFWAGHRGGGRGWWLPTAAACGLAVLTKGPVGVALPGAVIALYFAWNRELGRLLDRRAAAAGLVFLLVAGPWYALVAVETRGEWVRAFVGTENLNRFLSPMEGHRGPVWFYPAAVLGMFAPWSVFLVPAVWYGVKGARRAPAPSVLGTQHPSHITQPDPVPADVRAHRFLLCWAGVYLAFFSAAATKLPNYVFPLYPALAVLTARFLVRWREGAVAVPRWVMPAAAAGVLLVGVGVAGGLLYADRVFPGVGAFALLGLVPVLGAGVMAWRLRRGDRGGVVAAAAAAAVLLVGAAAAAVPVLDRQKAPRDLVRESGAGDPGRDVRVAALGWFQPSVVFYTGREVERLPTAEAAARFLAVPTPGYLFVPAAVWERLAAAVPGPHRVAARHFDFLKNCDVVVVTNAP
ncbi:MAG: hypothetical protein C0501_04040 [Isosphaera sp.]|nr:hypothetical protein [Isosphaera sp.]